LGYGNLFEIASKNISELNLNFLSKNTSYKFENGVDKIYFSKNENVKLSESASSFQSIIPLLLPIINEKENQNKQYSFVIEEPETNLFPKAQYELMKFLEKDRKDDFGMIDKGSIHTYTTHSPFILSSLNNMLYAYKMGLIDRKNKNIIEKISKIIPEENWIDPNTFSAYEIKNGKAKNIFDRKSGLIKENAIDLISEDIIEDFRKIAIATIE
jgi:predicted ATPase